MTLSDETSIIAAWRATPPVFHPRKRDGLLVACGCSTTTGMGLPDRSRAYAPMLADTFGMRLVNLAKPAASNFHIAMQVKSAIEMKADFVTIMPTTLCRTDFVRWDGHFHSIEQVNDRHDPLITARDFSYEVYPFTEGEPHPFVDDPHYNPMIISTVFQTTVANVVPSNMVDEPKSRLNLLRDWFAGLYDIGIKGETDMALMIASHHRLLAAGIDHVFLTGYQMLLKEIPDTHLVPFDWCSLIFNHGMVAEDRTHPNEEGHRFLHDMTLKTLADRQP